LGFGLGLRLGLGLGSPGWLGLGLGLGLRSGLGLGLPAWLWLGLGYLDGAHERVVQRGARPGVRHVCLLLLRRQNADAAPQRSVRPALRIRVYCKTH